MYQALIFAAIFCLFEPLFAQQSDSNCIKDSKGTQFCVGQSVYVPSNYSRLGDADYYAIAGTDPEAEAYFKAYRAKTRQVRPEFPIASFNGFPLTHACNKTSEDGYYGVISGIMKPNYISVRYVCNDNYLAYPNRGTPVTFEIDTKPESLMNESDCSAGGAKLGDVVTTVNRDVGRLFGQIVKCYSGGATVGFFKVMYHYNSLACLSNGGEDCENSYNSNEVKNSAAGDKIAMKQGIENRYYWFMKNTDLQNLVKSVKEFGGFRVGDHVNYVNPIQPCKKDMAPVGCTYEPWNTSKKAIVRFIFSDGTVFISENLESYNLISKDVWAVTTSQLKK